MRSRHITLSPLNRSRCILSPALVTCLFALLTCVVCPALMAQAKNKPPTKGKPAPPPVPLMEPVALEKNKPPTKGKPAPPPVPLMEPVALEKIRAVDGGRIEAIHVSAGETVEADTTVVTLDHFRQKHLLEVAKVRAEDCSKLRETAADVANRKSILDELRQRARRRLASEEQVRQAEAQVEIAEAKRDAALSAQRLTELDLDMAKLNYENRFLRNLKAGVVLNVEKELGESVAGGMVILTLADTSGWKTRVPIPSDLAGVLRMGMLIPYTAGDGTQGMAWVSQILPDGLVELVIANNNPQSAAAPAVPEFRFSELRDSYPEEDTLGQ